MPELPDILLYLNALEPRIVGQRVAGVRLASPFLLRSVDPPLSAVEGRQVVGLRRLGKRVVIETERELFLVIHLMIAGRFRWKPRGAAIPGKIRGTRRVRARQRGLYAGYPSMFILGDGVRLRSMTQ